MKIAVVNASSLVGKREASLMVAACARQAVKHFAYVWEFASPRVRLASSLADAKTNEHVIVLLDDPDIADADGYHTETPDGREYGRVFVRPILDRGGALLDKADSVSVVLSHEILEMLADPWCTLWVDGPRGRQYSMEVCDPVQECVYAVNVRGKNVLVSDFVLPSWFDDDPGTKQWSWCDKAPGAFKLAPGGYAIVRDSGKGEHPIFAKQRPARRRSGRRTSLRLRER